MTYKDSVMAEAQAVARQIAEQLVEKRVRGLQRIVSRREIEIAELKRRLAELEPQEDETDE